MTASHAAPYRAESDWPTSLGANTPRPHGGRHLPSAVIEPQPAGYAPLPATSHVVGYAKPALTLVATTGDDWDMLVIL